MKTKCFITLLVVGLNLAALAAPRDAEWKAVQDAVKKGLPQTAITNLEPIITAAMKEKAYAEATKAIGQKIALEGSIQGNKAEERVVRLEAEIAKAPAEMKPVLQTLLAHWYWSYFQQNRWRFMQRTQTAEAPGKDFTTWDLPRLFAEIDKHFQAALAAEKTLKATPIAAWDGLLEKGTMPDSYRPTLYDFLAHEALEFYTSGEQAGAKAEGEFELMADSPALDGAEKFLAWHRTFAIKELPDSPMVKALDLYGRLLTFHQNDSDKSAFLDADLARLVWAWNTAFGEEKNARFKAALKGFIAKWGDHELAAMASWNLARVIKDEGDWAGARKIAAQAKNAHAGSPGAKQCANLIAEIDAKSATINAERVWNSNPSITVRYRNVDKVFFRAYAANWESFLDKKRPRPENISQQEKRDMLAKAATLEWSAALPATADFKERTFSATAPTTLKPGFYFIFASHDANFGEKQNQISMATIWVSELALVLRPRAGLTEGFVLEAGSGEPVVGAEVNAWYLDQNGSRIPVPPLSTDTNGFFSFKPVEHRSYLFLVRHQGRELASANDLYNYYWGQDREGNWPQQRTIFFTDRAIYRPGQTIQYKGICLETDQRSDSYKTLAGEQIEVAFQDPNGKEIARAKHRANDFGSFSGSFTAPRDRVMGQMHIVAQGRGQGAASFSVEEYKRPKFEVTLGAPKVAPKLGDKASVTGKATSYTGAAVDGAKVSWRVMREVRWPWWCGWWRPMPSSGAQEIAHGTTKTGVDGAFTVEFVAKPDLSISPTNEPTFVYSITADVTDTAGETRSDEHSIRVGYAALEATVSAGEWQEAGEPVELTVRTATLDGEPQVAEGVVKIYRLKAPAKVVRARVFAEDFNDDGKADADQSSPNNWELADVAEERGFTTGTNGMTKLSFKLAAGAYRVMLETQDRFGKKVTGRLPLQVVDLAAANLAIKVPQLAAAPSWESQPGEEFMMVWGTGYETGRAFIEIESRDKFITRYWTSPNRTQQQIKLAVTEALHGGFTVHITQVRENRGYLRSCPVSVPWKNKELELKWEHLTSKLIPGQRETWTLQIKNPTAKAGQAEKAAAELVATLYDESLDAFAPQNWPMGFGVFRYNYSTAQAQFGNAPQYFQHCFGNWNQRYQGVSITYRHFPSDLTERVWSYGWFGGGMRFNRARRGQVEDGALFAMNSAMPAPAAAPMALGLAGAPMEMAKTAPASVTALSGLAREEKASDRLAEPGGVGGGGGGGGSAPKPDLSKVAARKNLNETAFFFPQLTSDSNGVVRMTFTMPEALTKWRFLGFAHDTQLRAGLLDGHAVTAKDIMVQPNPPRFLREGDTVEFTVKISNQSDKPQRGAVKLAFADAMTQQSADKLLGVQALVVPPSGGSAAGGGPAKAGTTNTEQSFNIPAKESRTFSWRISVPDGAPFLTYKAVASTGVLSDGEEGYLPVLSRRIFVTESLPLPIRGKLGGGEVVKKFEFGKLLNSGKSKTLQHEGVTVQMVSQPAWYAVLALPYLMEFPHECSEQTFNRFYANALARHIANSDPKIRRIFDQWKNTPALDSPLEKNQDLKAVMIEETPWYRQAKNESEARRNVGILFDDNRLNTETAATLQKLTEMQIGDGRWPWFPGGYGNDYITLYIVTGFGRLRHLDVDVPVDPALRALNRLDEWMTEHYQKILEGKHPEEYVPSATDALYLYGRSFFLKDQPVAPQHKKALEFYIAQSRKFWLQTNNRQTQAHLAIALKRFWDWDTRLRDVSKVDSTPMDIIKSLRERSVTNEEMGRFWRDTELSWWWYHAPIETQALMIEAFDEVAGDAQAVEDCRVWLLKQKQTQDWKTTKATADAVYGLLLRGKNILASDKLVEVSLGDINVTPGGKGDLRSQKSEAGTKVEPGTGFYERHFTSAEVKAKMGEITVRKVDEGVSWGSVHWQYFEDMSKVTPYEGTPLKLKKSLFTKVNTAKGPTLEPVRGALAVGDELVVRIELRVDRDMEYVHLKDQRGSGTEPVNVLSRYKYQDGLGYYESTRDTASHFYIDYLPKGTYVFEYSTRVQLRGSYQTGMAQIQCMYAPEFNSHSESLPIIVK
ncbi:MAG: hypothetical protein RLY20_2620 [Verrucomicrobiota bacterium]|jgi:hypothetical protein